jgi:putative ABC transport system permease protein
MRVAGYVAELSQDVSYAARTLRRTPAFTAVAVATLALGIGANSAIFSVVRAVLFDSLPFRNAERLHVVRTLYPDGAAYPLSAPDFMSIREQTRAFERVEAYTIGELTLLGAGEPRDIRRASVSDGLIEMLGLTVAHGRGFLPDENGPAAGAVAILDHGFWQRDFGGDRGVLGRVLSLGGSSYTIVGVLAPLAALPDGADVHTPLRYDDTFSAITARGRRSEYLSIVARARSGVDAVQVDHDVRRLGTELQAAFPDTNQTLTFRAMPLREMIVGDVERPLLVLFGAVALVLLIACANVANLLLARASARQGELAVRAALGAGTGRLARQLITEALVLSLAGGAAGLAIAYWGTQALVAVHPPNIPRMEQVHLSSSVVVFTLLLALFTGLAFGTVPALHATRGRLVNGLREGGRGGSGARGRRVRALIVVAEMALAVVLLTGAGLLIRSFIQLMRVDPGFHAEQAMFFRLTLQGSGYPDAARMRSRVAEFENRLRVLPGVAAVAATSVLPLSGFSSIADFAVEGAPPPGPDVNREIAVASVTPEYFRAIGAPIVAGRGFTERDVNTAPLVAVVNRAAVRRWFADADPIGRHVVTGGARRQVVGVVTDTLHTSPGQSAEPQLFTPYAQRATRSLRVVVRTTGDPMPMAASIRAEIHALDPNLAVGAFAPLEQLLTRSVAGPRFYSTLLALFAGVALALAAVGIFGVISYSVTERAREIGVRIALGAGRGDVLRMIVGGALALAASGMVIGLAVSVVLGRAIQSQLFGVRLLDPPTVGAVALVLIASASAASFLPARRAAALDPAITLREG